MLTAGCLELYDNELVLIQFLQDCDILQCPVITALQRSGFQLCIVKAARQSRNIANRELETLSDSLSSLWANAQDCE